MQNLFPVHHSPHMCNEKKIKHTDLCYFHMLLTWLDWSRSRSWSRSFWSRSHNRFLVSVLHSLVSVLALVSLCSGLINKPAYTYLPEVCRSTWCWAEHDAWLWRSYSNEMLRIQWLHREN